MRRQFFAFIADNDEKTGYFFVMAKILSKFANESATPVLNIL